MDITIALFFSLGALILGGLLMKLWLQARHLPTKQAYAEQLISEKYVPKEAFTTLQETSDILRADLHETQEDLRRTELDLAEKSLTLEYKENQFHQQAQEADQLRKQAIQEFEHIATKLLTEKTRQFTLTNKYQMDEILTPLKEKIGDFKKDLDQKYLAETSDRISLREEMKHLRSLNQQLSNDANNLASALKGDNKMQGNWGELQLERILENTGLKKDIHYSSQFSALSENGHIQRPDFVIHLPNKKHIIIDSKVSLKAFDLFHNTNDLDLRKQHLKAHIKSVRQHVKDLHHKEYQNIPSLNSPDYILLFVPIEPAFTLAIQEDVNILSDAMELNIVLVTTSTLLATIRTVAYLWKQDKQSKSVIEIAKISGQLYDKFSTFIDEMQNVGKRIDSAQNHWAIAMKKLSEGKNYEETILGKAEKIKELGARTTKRIVVKELR